VQHQQPIILCSTKKQTQQWGNWQLQLSSYLSNQHSLVSKHGNSQRFCRSSRPLWATFMSHRHWLVSRKWVLPGCNRDRGGRFVKSRASAVLWCCWLGSKKGIRPVKKWVVGCWRGCLWWGADFHIAQQMPLLLTISCSSKSRLVWTFLILPFWYRLTRVVPDIFQKSSKTVVCVLCVMLVAGNKSIKDGGGRPVLSPELDSCRHCAPRHVCSWWSCPRACAVPDSQKNVHLAQC